MVHFQTADGIHPLCSSVVAVNYYGSTLECARSAFGKRTWGVLRACCFDGASMGLRRSFDGVSKGLGPFSPPRLPLRLRRRLARPATRNYQLTELSTCLLPPRPPLWLRHHRLHFLKQVHPVIHLLPDAIKMRFPANCSRYLSIHSPCFSKYGSVTSQHPSLRRRQPAQPRTLGRPRRPQGCKAAPPAPSSARSAPAKVPASS